jgi:DNA-binding XRE family transcriptional regulator
MKRVSRGRKLTPEEAAKYNKIREQFELEKPELTEYIRGKYADHLKGPKNQGSANQLGRKIRDFREVTGQSQVTLAAAAGISQGYLSQLEAGEREPTLSIAARLARALRISLDDLAAE